MYGNPTVTRKLTRRWIKPLTLKYIVVLSFEKTVNISRVQHRYFFASPFYFFYSFENEWKSTTTTLLLILHRSVTWHDINERFHFINEYSETVPLSKPPRASQQFRRWELANDDHNRTKHRAKKLHHFIPCDVSIKTIRWEGTHTYIYTRIILK